MLKKLFWQEGEGKKEHPPALLIGLRIPCPLLLSIVDCSDTIESIFLSGT